MVRYTRRQRFCRQRGKQTQRQKQENEAVEKKKMRETPRISQLDFLAVLVTTRM